MKKNNKALKDFIVQFELNSCLGYLNLVDEWIRNVQADLTEKIKKRREQLVKDEEKDGFDASSESEWEMFGQTFPNYLSSSVFLLQCFFCEKMAGTKVINGLPNTSKIRIFKTIRDSIVHNGGKLKPGRNKEEKEKSAKVRRYIKNTKGIRLTDCGEIIIGNKFCKYANKVIGKYLTDLADK